MSIEATVYARLSADATLTGIIGQKLYPSIPTENTQLPFVVYTCTATEPQTTLTGSTNLTRHDVQIDAWAINLDDVLAILDACKDSLHCWTSNGVKGSFLTGRTTDEQDTGQHGQATFSVWVSV